MNSFRPFSLMPPVVKNLLIINGLCFLAKLACEQAFHFDLNDKLGLYFPTSSHFMPLQLITHVFMHGNFMHLFTNMFSLWMFGTSLENHWGPKRFFIYYFATAFGAAALHLGINGWEVAQLKADIEAFNLNPDVNNFTVFMQEHRSMVPGQFYQRLEEFRNMWATEPGNTMLMGEAQQAVGMFMDVKMNGSMVGASGAVFGILIAFGMLFPNVPLMLIFFPIPIKAKYFVALYGLFELYQGIANNPSDPVAHFAHLGGMLFGFILIKIWQRKENRFNRF